MSHLATYIEQRRHPRAQLHLTARVRWRGPFGMRLETTRTYDVSRDGISVHRAEPCELNAPVWIVCPFESSAYAVLPETPARVVRVDKEEDYSGYRVALRLEVPTRQESRPPGTERRAVPRSPFALPIFVRAASTPWPEESMTQDISRRGVRFSTARIFAVGDEIRATVPWGEWTNAGEIPGVVVRVTSEADSPGPAPMADPGNRLSGVISSVAVRWVHPPKT
jgi:hypothetical protein